MRALTTAASLGRHSFSAVVEALILLAIVIALTLGLALANGSHTPAGADPVLAAKGGGGGGDRGGGKPPRSSATLSVTPNPVAAGGAVYTVSGGGYGAGAMVGVNLATPGCCMAFNVLADSSGRISFQTTTAGPGTYTVKTIRYGSTTVLASATFAVQ